MSYKDLFKSFRFALSFKKLLILYPLSALFFLLYLNFDYLTLTIFIIYYFFSKILISKLTYEQIKGDYFYELKRAFKFSIKGILKYIGFIIIFVILAIFILLIIYTLIFISKIHNILLYISFPLLLIFTILLFYLIIGLIVSESVGISAISTQNYDSFDIIFESFSMFNNQLHRLISYKLISIISAIFGGFIFFIVLYLIIQFLNQFLSLNELHILYILTYLFALSYSFSILFISDLIGYLVLVYKRDNVDISKLEPEIYSQRT